MSNVSIENPQRIEGGWRVRETEYYFIDVMVMMGGNLRVTLTCKDAPGFYARGWCYHDSLPAVVLAAGAFDADGGEEPIGWIKEIGTERRSCASYYRGGRRHKRYSPDCPDCGNEALY
jgi:hypothetical protein